MSNIIKIFQSKKHGNYLFLCIRGDLKEYKVKEHLDRFGNLVTHVEKYKDVLMAVSSLNNIHKTWRVNGWKRAEKELIEDGYVFVKEMPSQLTHLTQQREYKNLQRFINNEPLVALTNIHALAEGQTFTKKGFDKPLYKIVKAYYDSVVVEHLTLQIKNRRGEVSNFRESFNGQRFEGLIRNKTLIPFEL